MALRVGIDLVSVTTVSDAIEAQGDRYLRRVYTEHELADCAVAGKPAAHRLAARFAAKEAVFKALRVGDQAASWQDVEVDCDESGMVALRVHGQAASLAATAGISNWSLSITHEGGLAGAIVIAEIRASADT